MFSNDPVKKREYLILAGTIKPLINVKPSHSVALRGKPGEVKSMDLVISAGIDKPLEIKPGKFTLEGKVKYDLKVVEEGKQYKITFQNNPDVSGKFPGYLRLLTNYKNKPQINIRINSRFK